MSEPLKIDAISLPTFKAALTRYPQHIPATLADLERFRSQTITRTLQERRARKPAREAPPKAPAPAPRGRKKKPAPPAAAAAAVVVQREGPHLTKEELGKLVEWKLYVKTSAPCSPSEECADDDPLRCESESWADVEKQWRNPEERESVSDGIASWGRRARRGGVVPAKRDDEALPSMKHGTFRPTLLSLVSSNPDNTVSALTAAVFSLYDSGDEPADVPSLVSRLTALKGVGPATASLVLSAFDPARVPFFGDELFRWAMWDAPVSGRAAPGASATGWKRKIGYSAKEYAALVDVVERVTARLGVPASEVERVAFVLGREGASVDEGVEVEDEAKAAGGGGKRKISNGGDAARDEDSELEKKKRRA